MPTSFQLHCLSLLLIVTGLVLPLPSSLFDHAKHVGFAESRSDGTFCVAIKNASLKEGDHVDLVVPDARQRHLNARIAQRLTASCAAVHQSDEGESFYTARPATQEQLPLAVSFAIVGFSGKFSERGGRIRADLDGDGILNSFRSCTSSEGLHLTVWSGQPHRGKRRWHRYYYLGYDVEPTCSDADY